MGSSAAVGDSCDDGSVHSHHAGGFHKVAQTAEVGAARVAFPTGYDTAFTQYASRDRVPKKQVVEVFANQVAVDSARGAATMADGSVLVMEVYKAAVDAQGEAKKMDNGRFEKGDLAAIVVMEKQAGWGAAYADEIRNGDWEYAKFKANGEASGDDTKACFECHKPLETSNFVFTFAELDAVKP